MIFVTNKNDEIHSDMFNGKEFVFPPNVAVPVDEAAASHMLGYGEADKTRVLSRLGWAARYDEDKRKFVNDDAGFRRLAKFVFSKAAIVRADDEAAVVPESGNLLDESPI